MAVERSGQLPLDFVFLGGAVKDDLIDYLYCQMHCIRHLRWPAGSGEFLRQYAPLLESLHFRALSPIPEDLFLGLPGRLRTLKLFPLVLPPHCPALASVTSLCTDVFCYEHHSGSLANLFAVCPLLEHLGIDGLADAHLLPLTSRTPTRLKLLTLRSTGSYASDIVCYVHAWAPTNPSLARILLYTEVLPADAAPVFAGAETLVVTQHAGRGSPTIETTRSDGRKFTLVRRGGWSAKVNYDVLSATLAGIIRPHTGLLGALRVLRAPVTVLDALLSPEPAPALPTLRELTVLVQMWIPRDQSLVDRIMYGDPDPVFPASLLACLQTLGQSPLALIEVVLGTAKGHVLTDENVQDVLTPLADSLPPRDQDQIVDAIVCGLREGLSEDTLPHVPGYLIGHGSEGEIP